MSKSIMIVTRYGGNERGEHIGEIECDISEKSFVLKHFYKRQFDIGGIQQTKDVKVLFDGSGAFGAIKDWKDGSYTIYDRGSGTAYTFIPKIGKPIDTPPPSSSSDENTSGQENTTTV